MHRSRRSTLHVVASLPLGGPVMSSVEHRVRQARQACRRRADEFVGASPWVAAPESILSHAPGLWKARPVARGGALSDALSNRPMQWSAFRNARMASLRRSRPLMDTLNIACAHLAVLVAAALWRPLVQRSRLPRRLLIYSMRHDSCRRGSGGAAAFSRTRCPTTPCSGARFVLLIWFRSAARAR